MSTRVLSLLLALTLLWSAFMATGPGAQVAQAAEPTQVAQLASIHNGLDSDHENGHDSTPAEAAFGEPAAQGLLEGSAEPVALFGHHPATPTPPLTMARPRAPAVASWPAPVLDGPRRPPRPTALVG